MSVGEDLTRVLQRLVSQPDAVVVDETVDNGLVRLEVRVAKDDLGAVIGRRGRTINALRTLLGARGQRFGQRHDLRLLEDE